MIHLKNVNKPETAARNI